MDSKKLTVTFKDSCEIRKPLAVVRKPLPKVSRFTPAFIFCVQS